jgi:hypothetical protein
MTNNKSPWFLTDAQAAEVERGHREMMALDAMEIKPIRLSADGAKLRAECKSIITRLIDFYGCESAEKIIYETFQATRAEYLQESVSSPGTTQQKPATGPSENC